MVKNRIKVCARIKGGKQPKYKVSYVIHKDSTHEMLCLEAPATSRNCCKRGKWSKFRFSNVFDVSTKQEQIFGVVAQPIINSFLNGFNGTIFAYGQTGSGKTYTITGSPENYNERGIIPRSIEQVFRFTSKCCDKTCIGISYMEIYNEVGYDLLDSKHQAYCFEQLPKIVLLEDSKGEIHLRNLSVHNVSSVKEAMRLLFLGDTNRTIAETPSNEVSSRSHCIFTIYLSFWVGGSAKIRRSKLNLVDLAGSERIHKSNVSGVTLMEAKSINLSLYYLEQVILALSDAKRSHVPYRNSIMTNILKDSLGGNCFTLMLATVTISHYNFEETISTCKFSQRVAMVSTDAHINEEYDPYQEISQLTKEVEILRNHLKLLSCSYEDVNTALTDDEISRCKEIVTGFIDSDETCPTIEPNMKIIQHCFSLLKREICQLNSQLRTRTEKDSAYCDYDDIIKGKDEEIARLNMLLRNELCTENKAKNDTACYSYTDESPPITCRNMDATPRRSKEEIRIFKIQGDLHKKYDIANSIVPLIEQCQRNIIMIRKKIDSHQLPDDNTQSLLKELQYQQDIYRESLMQLQSIKAQVEHLQHGLQQAEFVMGNKLKRWVRESSSRTAYPDIPPIDDVRSTTNTSLGSTSRSVTVSTHDVKEIGLQTLEDAIAYYSNNLPSTSYGYSRNNGDDLKRYDSLQSFCIDCDKYCERSKSAKCLRNGDLLQPLNGEVHNDLDRPQSEISTLNGNCCRSSDSLPEVRRSFKESRDRQHPSSENIANTRRSFKESRVILVADSEYRKSKEISPPTLEGPSNIRKSLRESVHTLPPGSKSCLNNRKSLNESRVIRTPDSENLANVRDPNRVSREISPRISDSSANARRYLTESREILPLDSNGPSIERRSLKESTHRRSCKGSRVSVAPDSGRSVNGRDPNRTCREISAPIADNFTNVRKSLIRSREIVPSNSGSHINTRKKISVTYYNEDDPDPNVPLYQDNHSEEDLCRNPSTSNYPSTNSNSVVRLKKSSRSCQVNNGTSVNEDGYNTNQFGQGIQSVEESHYSVPCLNVTTGITSHSQNTFLSNKVGSFLDGCHLLRQKVPYFDVHVKIDPSKQIKTTTVHQKIVSINPESDDISGLLIPPSFFNKSSKEDANSDISSHPLQKEQIPKLIRNLAGNLFFNRKLNKQKSESESTTSPDEEEITEGDKVEHKKCSCEESSSASFADNVSQEIHKTSVERPQTSSNCSKETNENITICETSPYFKDSDSKSFIEFIKTVPLTGDRDVDEEIVNFYRTKFKCK